MKLRRLELVAFGPFTGTVLDFGEGDGLHLVCGANEAGKSSSMRALKNFLYGIPHRFSDNFLHENKAIEIRGALDLPGGERLELRRRKALKNDLVDLVSGNPLDQTRLTALLGGVGEEAFGVMFGFDHHELSAGGGNVLATGGALGQTLFAAASGVVHLRDALARLKDEEEALFTPRGGAGKRVNAQLNQLKELRREQREALVSPARWQELIRLRDDLTVRLEALQGELDAATRNKSRLERYLEAAAPARQRAEVLVRLAELRDAPALGPDFPGRRTAALLGRDAAQRDEHKAHQAVNELDQRLAALTLNPGLVAAAEQVKALYRDISQHTKALVDIDKRRDERRLLLGQATRILASLRPDLTLEQAGLLRLNRADQVRIQELGRRHEALVERRDKAEGDLRRQQRDLETARAELAATPVGADTAELALLLKRTASDGDPQVRWRDAHALRVSQEQRAQAELARLGRWQGALSDVETLAVPDEGVLHRLEARLNELNAARKNSAQAERETSGRLAESKADLQRFMDDGPVPRPKDLRLARELRDSGWSLIRRTLAGTEPGDVERSIFLQNVSEADDLPQAYELCVQRSDAVADGLYRDADRVARRAELEVALDRQGRQLQAERQRLSDLEAEDEAVNVQWRALWEPLGVEPAGPSEMLSWLNGWKRLCDMLELVREQRAVEERIEAEAKTLGQGLRAALERMGEAPPDDDAALGSLLAVAQAVLERHTEQRLVATALTERVAGLERTMAEAQTTDEEAFAALGEWAAAWAQAVAPLGLGPKALPAEAQAVLDELSSLFAALDEAEKLEARVRAMQADYEAYSNEVRMTCRTLAPEVDAPDPAAAATELFRLLMEVQPAAEQHGDILAQRERQQHLLEEARRAAAEHGEALGLLCAEAGCAAPEGLEQAEVSARRRAEAEHALTLAEERLLALCGGQELNEFALQAMEQDPDAAAADIARLGADIAARSAERETLLQELGGLKKQLADLDGTSLAADKAQEAQGLAAEIQTGVDRLVRLRLAAAVVAREVERYRRDNQGPVLDRASLLFKALTLGNFSGLEVDFDAKGEPVLLGARANGERLGAAAMSDGTRDQLYLALRLAGLHRYLDNHPPMPFIVDDILVNFDDDRSRATLAALAELAGRTQVVFFTHHAHLLDLARQAVPADTLTVHTL
ncbi:MAG: AAA family ATPase [Proteobacteria bacterium]|nr:AAA family ATPase [Pseudomonadota bacterium]